MIPFLSTGKASRRKAREELRPVGQSFSATIQGRLRRRIDIAPLDLVVNDEACAWARGQSVLAVPSTTVLWLDSTPPLPCAIAVSHPCT